MPSRAARQRKQIFAKAFEKSCSLKTRSAHSDYAAFQDAERTCPSAPPIEKVEYALQRIFTPLEGQDTPPFFYRGDPRVYPHYEKYLCLVVLSQIRRLKLGQQRHAWQSQPKTLESWLSWNGFYREMYFRCFLDDECMIQKGLKQCSWDGQVYNHKPSILFKEYSLQEIMDICKRVDHGRHAVTRVVDQLASNVSFKKKRKRVCSGKVNRKMKPEYLIDFDEMYESSSEEQTSVDDESRHDVSQEALDPHYAQNEGEDHIEDWELVSEMVEDATFL